jgi:hypothetical protein
MSTCSNCQALARVIQKQQAEIEALKRIIASVKAVCVKTVADSDKVLKPGGVSRGEWSFARGAKETAENIAKKLR